ncbi:hypothetical protein M3Y95_00391500 [Aphelenchoides besseyi]|nr:hypothetical protein M3Y95_00391500 [Aphelenchoides besseyi]
MLIADRLNSPFQENDFQYGLGFYMETETQRLYFYVSFALYVIDKTEWKVYRFAVDQEPTEWEFVGDLDIEMKNVGVSPCGRYFWSLKFPSNSFEFVHPLLFWQVDIQTLAYEEFEIDELRINNEFESILESAYFRHTTYGTFLLVYMFQRDLATSKCTDEVFLMSVNQMKRKVHFKHIGLPKLPTLELYRINRNLEFCREGCWRIGFIELHESIYFYRIDYFGDLYVLNWHPTGPLNWTKFSITGNYRPRE